MVDAMLICGIEAIVLMAQAYYVEQVGCKLPSVLVTVRH